MTSQLNIETPFKPGQKVYVIEQPLNCLSTSQLIKRAIIEIVSGDFTLSANGEHKQIKLVVRPKAEDAKNVTPDSVFKTVEAAKCYLRDFVCDLHESKGLPTLQMESALENIEAAEC